MHTWTGVPSRAQTALWVERKEWLALHAAMVRTPCGGTSGACGLKGVQDQGTFAAR